MGYSANGDVVLIGTWEQLRNAVETIQSKEDGLSKHAIENIGKCGMKRYKEDGMLALTVSLYTWDPWNLYSWFDFIHMIKKAVPELRIEAECDSWYSVSDVDSRFTVVIEPGEVWKDSHYMAGCYFVDGIG